MKKFYKESQLNNLNFYFFNNFNLRNKKLLFNLMGILELVSYIMIWLNLILIYYVNIFFIIGQIEFVVFEKKL